MWRQRRWRLLLNLIDHLPSWSFYAEAQAADEELAERFAARGIEPVSGPPRISEWTPERAELANLTDRLGELMALIVASARLHDRPKFPSPRPRPESAIDRILPRLRETKHRALVARLRGTPKT